MTRQTDQTGEPLTRGQASHRLGLSPERVRQLGKLGVLPYQETPLGRLYDAAGVEAYAAEREQRRQASGR